jgi:hypothetical protein
VLIVTSPIGALELRRTDPTGRIVEEQLFNPASVIFLAVVLMYADFWSLKSFGVAQKISPSQYSLTFVRGVEPETISQH